MEKMLNRRSHKSADIKDVNRNTKRNLPFDSCAIVNVAEQRCRWRTHDSPSTLQTIRSVLKDNPEDRRRIGHLLKGKAVAE